MKFRLLHRTKETMRWGEMNGHQKRLVIVLVYGLFASVLSLYFLNTSDKILGLYLFGSAVAVLNLYNVVEWCIAKRTHKT